MTVMEAKAEAIARVLAKGANEWKKKQAEEAGAILQELFVKGQLSPADFAQAVSEATGNVSQMLQALERHGAISVARDCPAFIAKAIERRGEIDRELDAKLKEMHEKPKGK